MNSSSSSPAVPPFGLALAYGSVLFEMAIDMIGLPISSLNFYALYRTSVIHRNLKFILLCQSAAFMMRFGIKLAITMPIRLFGPNILWHEAANPITLLLFYSNICFRSLLGHVIVVKMRRGMIMATLLAKKYEQNRGNLFSSCWLAIVLTIVAFNVCSQQLLPPSNNVKQTIVTVASSYALLLLSLIEIGFFISLWIYNKQKYRHANEVDQAKNYTLSERYQQLENIRTCLQLVPTLICHFLYILDLVQGQTFVLFGIIPDLFYEALVVQVTNMVDAILSLLAELTMIMMHPFLRRDIRVLLSRLFRGNRVHIAAVSTSDIRMMMRGVTFEGHFEMLKSSWEYRPPE